MDNDDKEFETFLEQFELRHQRPFPQENPVEARTGMQWWIMAAAAVIVASLLSIPLLRHFFQPTYPGAIVETAGDSSYRAGETVAGTTIRSGGFEPLSLRLDDGTRVEMRGQSELELESAKDGLRVRLSSGSILVTAAKQRGGHLYVETPDTIVSVVGTVFLVERTPLGTRVGVCEGEVEVARQGLKLRKLIPGEQTSTNPSLEGPLVEAIGWSSSAARLSALLQPVAVSPQTPPAVPEKEPKEPQKEQPEPGDQPRTEKPQSPPPPQVPPRPKKEPRPQEPKGSTDAGKDGPGKEILNRACSQCHVTGFVETTRYTTREAYASLIDRQRSMGAGLTDDESKVLADYLFRTYGIVRQ
jgi:FecR-like protein